MFTGNPSSRPRLALIAGPTASGKSARALEIAERENGTIVNADASQVYRDLRVLSARPTPADEARVPHLLYGYRDGAEACSAAVWAEDAKIAIAAVVAEGRLPVLVGGTGLYLRTLLDGIAPVPAIDPAVRAAVRALGPGEAHRALSEEDPQAAARLHPADTARTQRALEVVRATGRSVLEWREARIGGIRAEYDLTVERIALPTDTLYARCDSRVLAMIDEGAIHEVTALLARNLDPLLPVMRAIGVREIAGWIAGSIPRETAIAAMQQATRNYAKRQRTWFRTQHLDHTDVDIRS
jgi:tRNA dimethylallyltransferase